MIELELGEFVEWEGHDCVTLLKLESIGGPRSANAVVSAMRITDRKVVCYPGDVVYPRNSWRIAGVGHTTSVFEHAAAEQAAWDAGPGRRFT